MTRVAEQLFCGTAFFRTTILQRTFGWLLLIIDMFMLLQITGPNDSWIIVLLKGAITLIWRSANLCSYKNNMPRISHYNTIYFMRLCSGHLKRLTLISAQHQHWKSFDLEWHFFSFFFSFWTNRTFKSITFQYSFFCLVITTFLKMLL